MEHFSLGMREIVHIEKKLFEFFDIKTTLILDVCSSDSILNFFLQFLEVDLLGLIRELRSRLRI